MTYGWGEEQSIFATITYISHLMNWILSKMDKFVISIFLLIYLDVISKMLNPTYAIILKRVSYN